MAHPDGPAAGTPTDPWPATPIQPAAAELAPQALHRRGHRWLIAVAAATAVLAVVTFAAVAFWPRAGDDPAAPLAFQPLAEVARINFGEDTKPAFTQVQGDRVYAAAEVGGGLAVAAVDLTTGAELWRRSITGPADARWVSVVATPEVVMVRTELYPATDPRPLIILDARTGEVRWRHEISGNDGVFLRDGVVAVREEEQRRLVGLNLASGAQIWRVDFPEGQAAVVTPVYGEADLAGPSRLDGSPVVRGQAQAVMVGADRSARLIDLATGEVTWERTNVAGPRDWLLAYDGQLFVVEADDGYQILAYDLTTTDPQPRTVYTVDDPDRRLVARLHPCGRDRVCLLDRASADTATTEVVAIDTAGTGMVWRRSAPGNGRLLVAGELVVVNGGDTPVVGYDRDGEQVFDRAGLAVRLNAGNLLVFGDEPSSFRTDLSLVGYRVATGEFVGLDQARDVLGSGCSWDGAHLSCPARDTAVIWRFISE